ncbi:PTS sugar transporter subunit IIA [Levilactobacillus namurensis]|uniref:PTS sugar transporter subunit IIA n=1 Tax=Levilactobacillus namurensis TaxID=380393 RepID=UPI002230C0F7|nr:PTS sugar transporter subunit IIA [Levilactobacillus namurensis]MCW3779218.1 PTS sugar transporter subunit IIA [Levilactobacillus namurensis]MDT7019961.1 PTS sugar transporter subunit IIA [Levilactobacillus namurensis]WNN65461.1 PTS sugar transporter subunit IIA [Levilactobacillus namurensis]
MAVVQETLNPKAIIVNSMATSKDEVLKEMIHQLNLIGAVDDEEEFLKDVYVRESQGMTGIGNGVAIPHGKSVSVKDPAVAIATLDDPIEWESLDDQKIQIVVLFAVTDSPDGAQVHLKMLSEFAKKLGDDDVLDALKGANNIDEIVAAFD